MDSTGNINTTRLSIKSPAKINLFLYVTGRRADGYHELSTMMACIDLEDHIELGFERSEITVSCDNPAVPQDKNNIAFRAAMLFYRSYSEKIYGGSLNSDRTDFSERYGVSISIRKNIPLGAGLGGGSSNAAGVLKLMNRYYGTPFSIEELMRMGLELGADVPFFITGGTAFAEGIGEKLHIIDTVSDSRSILLFYPGIESSTAKVYKNLDFGLTKPAGFNIKLLSKTLGENQGFGVIEGLMHNDLESSACSLYPEIGLFRKELVDYLPEKVMMTGSGSTFFSLFSDYEKAQRCFNELSSRWRSTKRKVFMVSFLNARKVD